MADLTIDLRTGGALPVLDVAGEIDVYQAPRLRERLDALLDAGTSRLAVNLSSVTYIDSTGLGTLVAVRKRALAAGGELRLICPNPSIRRVFEITGLLPVFPFFDREESALSAPSAAP